MRFSIAARIIILALLQILSGSFPAGASSLRGMQRKHRSPVEAWSLCTRVTDGKGTESFYALFFLSGRLFMLSGNYAHYSSLALPSKEYGHESATAIPPLKKVKHSSTCLNERIGGHTIKGCRTADTVTIGTDFKQLQSFFTVVPGKPACTFKDVMGLAYDKRRFDWYLLPRCSVTVRKKTGAGVLRGTGHFQQFWGERGEANCDWIVAHARSGYDLVIARFPDDRKRLPWLPGDYILLSKPDGTADKITAFTLSVEKWWSSPASEKQYPLHYTVVSRGHGIDISLAAFTENQTKKIAGQEFWYGFGSMTGTIDGQEQHGWAYLAPLGENR